MTPSGVTDAPHTLITGGAGFIGSHLTERLLGQGERVVVIDDFSTGSRANLAAVADDPNLTVIESTVTGCKSLGSLVAESGFVFHLAAAVGVDLVVQSPIRTIETNLKATEAILEAAAPNRKPMLLPSSSEVYGKSLREGFKETDDLLIGPPTLGRWSYACSKLMDEFLALAFHAERQLPVIVARIFNTVGPRQTGRYGMVLPRFVEAAKAGEPLRVFGDGQQSRCFGHVADTVEALLRLAKCDPRSGGGVQHRLHRGGDHPQLGQAGDRVDWINFRDRTRAVPRGLRQRLRGHATSPTGHRQTRTVHRLPADDSTG